MPAEEIARLHDKTHSFENRTLPDGERELKGLSGELFDIEAEFEVGGAAECGLVVQGVRLAYDAKSDTLGCGPCSAPVGLQGLSGAAKRLKIRIVTDRRFFEVFVNDGLVYMPMGVNPEGSSNSVKLFACGNGATASAVIRELRCQFKINWTFGVSARPSQTRRDE
jgi:sucrose-6-phosphate hydrolase SacC (GH32 family)